MENTGNTVQVTFGSGVTVSGGGLSEAYTVLQALNTTVDETRYPMELHIVSIKSSYNQNVTAALKDSEGGYFNNRTTCLLEALTTLLSQIGQKGQAIDPLSVSISVDDLVPANTLKSFYRYLGSPDHAQLLIFSPQRCVLETLLSLHVEHLQKDPASTDDHSQLQPQDQPLLWSPPVGSHSVDVLGPGAFSQAASAEIQEIKRDMIVVKNATEDHSQKLAVMEEKLNELEGYHRRWNLRLYGLPEQEGEDAKRRVIDICRAVIPGAAEGLPYHVDVSHRIGRRMEGKIRPVITRFTTRSMRDAIWRASKDSDFLRVRKLKFGEDLTSKDKEARSKLWPAIEEARKQGKRAFFVGARAIIDGKEMKA
ncbi:hypothetical protein WMY93_002517 [Mugilogobius chulae]|uniref:Alpha-carbonic anhydrase domain-containing protein n=1 Tax=Mugilogobius chulae TaxID=88201 RepID=A0AAW0PU16_9GOBI